MGKAVKRFITRLGLAVLAVLVAYAGWKGGDAVFPRLESALGIGGAEQASDPSGLVTPEAAELARAKIESFMASEDTPELRLRSFEVSSLLRYTLTGMLPEGVAEPAVEMEGDRIELMATVVTSSLSGLPDLGGITGVVVPDTVAVSVGGSLIPFGDQRSMLLVRKIVVGGIPVPSHTFPEILSALGRTHERGLPESAILAPAHERIKGAYVEGGELVLVRA